MVCSDKKMELSSNWSQMRRETRKARFWWEGKKDIREM